MRLKSFTMDLVRLSD